MSFSSLTFTVKRLFVHKYTCFTAKQNVASLTPNIIFLPSIKDYRCLLVVLHCYVINKSSRNILQRLEFQLNYQFYLAAC